MFEFINFASDQIIVLLLVIIRTSGFFLIAPVFSDKSLPKLLKVGIVLVFSLVVMPVVPSQDGLAGIESVWQLVGLVLNEILIGFIIGLFFRLIFMGVLMAGTFVGYQMGFMFAQQFDRDSGSQVSIIGRFWYVLAMLFFLSISGHHLILNGVVESFQVIPLGNIGVGSSAGEMIIKYSAYIFIIAFKIAAPIMITLFLTDIALGTIAKTMPTMNVFFVGMPIKIAAGLAVMAVAMPLFVFVLEKTLTYFNSELSNLLLAVGKA